MNESNPRQNCNHETIFTGANAIARNCEQEMNFPTRLETHFERIAKYIPQTTNTHPKLTPPTLGAHLAFDDRLSSRKMRHPSTRQKLPNKKGHNCGKSLLTNRGERHHNKDAKPQH
jgi:hypothetical protein